MAQPNSTNLKKFIRVCARSASDLKKALKTQKIYVATSAPTSVVPFCHLTKAFQLHRAVLTLCGAGFGSESLALSRLILEMSMTLRWITNQDQVKRSLDFALFEAKRKEYFAHILQKYSHQNPATAGAVQYVENLYGQYTSKYASFKFWSNVPNNLRAMAAEPEILNGPQQPPQNDGLWHYDVPYSFASDHVHCTAVALAEVYPPINAPYEVNEAHEQSLIENAAFSATTWLFIIMLRVNTYRQLDMQAEIDRAYKPFSQFLARRNAQIGATT